MKFLLSIMVASLAFCSCGKKPIIKTETVTKDSIVERTVVVPRDTTIYIAGDSVTIHDSIPCPDVEYSNEATSKDGRVKAAVSLKDGKLKVDCKADSLQKLVTFWEQQFYKEKYSLNKVTTTVEKPVEVIVYKTKAWHWWLHLALLLALGWIFRKPLLSFIKHRIASWK